MDNRALSYLCEISRRGFHQQKPKLLVLFRVVVLTDGFDKKRKGNTSVNFY